MDALQVSLSSVTLQHEPHQAFRFFDLPFELRVKILSVVLVTSKTCSLDPENYRAGQKRLDIFLLSRQMHEDAYSVFYGGHTFRIFPTHGRFFGDKVIPLIARLPARYRGALTSLELRLGPGWNSPPKSWIVDDRLGLEQMTRVRILKLFIECDPSLDYFRGFRVDKSFYTEFSEKLLQEILQRLPSVSRVEVDGWPSVLRKGHLIKTLVKTAKRAGTTVIIFSDIESFEKRKEIYKETAKVLPGMHLQTQLQ